MKFYDKVREICKKHKKIALFVDMDGTIVEYNVYPEGFVTNETKEVFLNANPLDVVIDNLKRTNIKRLDDLKIFDDITISVRGKEMDSLPVQKYSKKIDMKLSPLQAYDEEVINSFENTRENFDVRYGKIKTILIKHKEFEQLEKLEEIKKAFENEKSEMR